MIHKKKKFFVFSIFFLAILLIAMLGNIFTEVGEGSWYRSLKLPSFTPPDGFYPILLVFLYVMIALAGTILYLSERSLKRTLALSFFYLQLLLNILWPFLFFFLRNPCLGAYDLIFLWLSILLCMLYSFKTKPLAGWLLVPYGVWVTFAGVMNFMILSLN